MNKKKYQNFQLNVFILYIIISSLLNSVLHLYIYNKKIISNWNLSVKNLWVQELKLKDTHTQKQFDTCVDFFSNEGKNLIRI